MAGEDMQMTQIHREKEEEEEEKRLMGMRGTDLGRARGPLCSFLPILYDGWQCMQLFKRLISHPPWMGEEKASGEDDVTFTRMRGRAVCGRLSANSLVHSQDRSSQEARQTRTMA